MKYLLEKTQTELGYLVMFFSAPERSFYELIFSGETAVGLIDEQSTREEFTEALEIEMTELFVNSPIRRPLYPIASEYTSDAAEQVNLREELSEIYAKEGKTVTHLPHDHIQVQLEFLNYLLDSDKPESAQEFCQKHIQNWTEEFVSAILDREPSAVVAKTARMLSRVCAKFANMR